MFKKILVCVNDSPDSEHVAGYGADIATRYNAEVVLLGVLDPSRFANPPYSALEASSLIDRHSASLSENTHRLSDQLEKQNISTRTILMPGKTAETIVKVAAAENADLIVMGGEPKSRIKSWLYGNLWSEVSRSAPCNVMRVSTAHIERPAEVKQAPAYLVGGLG